MKTILVPTDFSAAATNAACYAMHIARGLGANIKLCHAITAPNEAVMAAQVAWPLEDYTTLKKESTEAMFTLVNKLSEEEIAITAPHSYTPFIDFVSDLGSLRDVTRNLVTEHNMNLVIMGMSGAGGLSRFFLGSNSRDMIQYANFPLLLIPPKAKFKGIKKIGFATDLSETDIEIIVKLTYLARAFDAEILLSHITDGRFESDDYQYKTDKFLKDVTCKINYPKIYYRNVKSMDVNHGLEWIAEHAMVDILTMIHRPDNSLAGIFEGSHTKKIAREIDIPLLVFPPECNTAKF